MIQNITHIPSDVDIELKIGNMTIPGKLLWCGYRGAYCNSLNHPTCEACIRARDGIEPKSRLELITSE